MNEKFWTCYQQSQVGQSGRRDLVTPWRGVRVGSWLCHEMEELFNTSSSPRLLIEEGNPQLLFQTREEAVEQYRRGCIEKAQDLIANAHDWLLEAKVDLADEDKSSVL